MRMWRVLIGLFIVLEKELGFGGIVWGFGKGWGSCGNVIHGNRGGAFGV